MQKRIVVVDDDKSILSLIQTYLNKHSNNYDVVVTDKSTDVKRLIGQTKTDLLITDIRMPDMGGVELTKIIKEDYPSVKIMLMTAGEIISKKTYLNMADVYGADSRLEKPFSKEELIEAVNNVFSVSE